MAKLRESQTCPVLPEVPACHRNKMNCHDEPDAVKASLACLVALVLILLAASSFVKWMW